MTNANDFGNSWKYGSEPCDECTPDICLPDGETPTCHENSDDDLAICKALDPADTSST